uniref:ZM domain-containing protein n=1 Tax=Anisakis simplex TaxID=6269 RepID=A0A0M3K221_ANISI
LGAGPDAPIGANDKHFDPKQSETLRLINEGDNSEFGRNFFEKVAQAEAPHIPPSTEPSWTESARRRADRARSTTPSAYSYHEATPNRPVHTPTYQPQRSHYHAIHSSLSMSTFSTGAIIPISQQSMRSERSPQKGYEFGGLDFIDHSGMAQDGSYQHYYGYNSLPSRGRGRDERRLTPGYEMGGMDFRKGGVSVQGPYHGYGPEHRRLHPRFEKSPLRHDEMNIESAPNVDSVNADVLIGDTISNQKIATEEHGDERYSFGTAFGPTTGFKKDHQSVYRYVEPPRAPVFSLSAKKDLGGQEHTSGGRGAHVSGADKYESKIRSHSTAAMERNEWADSEKEVTIETLLNNTALIPRRRSVTPAWRERSVDKQTRWINMSDPRMTHIHSQTFTQEPNWSRTVQERKSAWEAQARDTDARVQMPASSKVPVQQPPNWYGKASQTHNVWQSEADRQASSDYQPTVHRFSGEDMAGGYTKTSSYKAQQQYSQTKSSTDHHDETTRLKQSSIPVQDSGAVPSSNLYQIQPYHAPSGGSTQQTASSYYRHNEQRQQTTKQLGQQPPETSSFSSVKHHEYEAQNGVPVSQSTYQTYTSTPAAITDEHHDASKNITQSSKLIDSSQSKHGPSAPLAMQEYRRSHYEMKSHDSTSTERTTNRPYTSTSASKEISHYDSSKDNLQRSSQKQQPDH